MSGLNLNRRILQAIRTKTAHDHVTRKFIQTMLFDELEHPSRWKFTKAYKNKISEYSKNWMDRNADRESQV